MFDGQKSKRLFYLILIGWFLLNVLQSVFMEIHEDESYYALWGQHLAWGYYDHPPFVALMTFLGSLVFPGTLGVRFMTVVCQAVSLIMIWKTLDVKLGSKKEVYLFFIITASFVMFEAYGFLTTPDPFLLFFTAAFLLAYKRFIRQENWGNTILLAVTMAGLVYSKYAGVLVIGFTILSNPRLMLRPKAWICVVVSVLLFSPHIWWQIQNDFVGMKYQVLERNGGFKWSNVGDFLGNQMLVFNPLTLGLFFYVLFRHRCSDLFERGCRFIAVGILSFFFVMIYKDRAEPHWTIAASIPMMVILCRNAFCEERSARYVRRWILPTMALFIIARVVLLTPLLSGIGFAGKEQRYMAMEANHYDVYPVVFRGSFQDASLYRFFTGNEATSLSSIKYIRHTQFDIWKFEEKYVGKIVWMAESPESYRIVNNFQNINRLEMDFTIEGGDNILSVSSGDTLAITYTITNPCTYDVLFAHMELPVSIKCVFEHNWKYAISDVITDSLPNTLPKGASFSGVLYTVVPSNLPFKKGGIGLCLDNTFVTPLLSELVDFKLTDKSHQGD